MATIIAEMLDSKILEPLTTKIGFTSTDFQPSAPQRIPNSKEIRLVSHFKEPSFLQQNDFLFKIDLTQAYFHVPINLLISGSSPFPARKAYTACLFFGLAPAPQAFASLSTGQLEF
ncbi:Retrotransposon protein [Nesidiocoris tenuis]|uniref:Retrotransposon protein n=1 Tax=Nesidiocoris tenuis TaxID=355587 RepID=A0ABN7BEG6_9HEMI|nr:Retrotransposon protein [Nesidiocoris tenuis]